MKKLKLFVLSLLLFVVAVPFVNAAEVKEKSEVNVYMFRGEGCGFCANALSFFDGIEEEYGGYFNLVTYEVWKDADNAELMQQVADYLEIEISGVPFIMVGDKTFPGFNDDYGEEIKAEIVEQYNMAESERTDLMKNMGAGVAPSKEDNTVFVLIILLVIVAVVVFVIYARKGNNESPEKITAKKNDEDEQLDDEEIIVVEKSTTKKKEKQEKEEKKEKKDSKKTNKASTNAKSKTTNSNKKKNK